MSCSKFKLISLFFTFFICLQLQGAGNAKNNVGDKATAGWNIERRENFLRNDPAFVRMRRQEQQRVDRGRKIFWGVTSVVGLLSLFPKGRFFLGLSLLGGTCALIFPVALVCFLLTVRNFPVLAEKVFGFLSAYYRILLLPFSNALCDTFDYCEACMRRFLLLLGVTPPMGVI